MNYILGDKVKVLIENSDISKGEKDDIISTERITYEELTNAFEKSQTEKNIMYYMSDLIPIFEVYDDQGGRGKKPKTAEYEKLMKRLRVEQDEKEYRKYLNKDNSGHGSQGSNVDGIGKYAFLPDSDIDSNRLHSVGGSAKEVKHQLTTILNILITVVSVGYAVWYWSGSSMGLGSNNAIRLLLSIFASILVLIAEVVVFGGYLRKVEEAKGRERKLAESRQVVSTVILGKAGKVQGKTQKKQSTRSVKVGNR